MEIVRNFQYDDIARSKSFEIIGRSVNVMDSNVPQPPPGSDEALSWEVLRQQSRTYFELGLLVHAVEALSNWAIHERQFTTKPRPAGGAPAALRQAKLELDESMAPLLAGILQTSVDDAEAYDLQYIRVHYLPEIIIAYNTALYTAGPTISRDSLLESMDLSTAIAKDSTGLSECFVDAGRMRELVNSFAQTSKLMLVMKAEGRPWKVKKDRVGRDLAMWEIATEGSAAADDYGTEAD